MHEFKNFRARMPAILRALAVGVPAGFLFDYLHTPIPWMIGPMVGVATLNLLGVKMHSPPYARQMGQVILGSAVSLYFTPPVVAALAGNLPAIIAATISVFIVGIFGALTLSKASGVDAKSTFFASIPGGAMAMAVLADRYGTQIAPVTVAHSLRVVGECESFFPVMGDKDRRNSGFFEDTLKIVQQFFPAGGIQGGERLIEQQQLRF